MKTDFRFAILNFRLVFTLWLAVGSLLSCNSKKNSATNPENISAAKYAVGFKVTIVGNSKLVEVKQPYQNATSGYQYLLVPTGEKPPPHDEQTQVITVPIEKLNRKFSLFLNCLFGFLDEKDIFQKFFILIFVAKEIQILAPISLRNYFQPQRAQSGNVTVSEVRSQMNSIFFSFSVQTNFFKRN